MMKTATTALTEKQLRFAEEYLLDFNASEAYKRAGYQASGHALYAGASRLLTNPKVQAYLAERRKEVVQRSTLSLERLTQELEHIAFSDPRDLFQENGALKNLSELPDGIARAVSGFELGDKVKVTLWDKLGAIEKALKLLNAYPDRKQDVPATTIVGVVVVPAKGSVELQQPARAAIESTAQRIERVDPEPPKAKTFKVQAARAE
jgi:phage terminase small subunit